MRRGILRARKDSRSPGNSSFAKITEFFPLENWRLHSIHASGIGIGRARVGWRKTSARVLSSCGGRRRGTACAPRTSVGCTHIILPLSISIPRERATPHPHADPKRILHVEPRRAYARSLARMRRAAVLPSDGINSCGGLRPAVTAVAGGFQNAVIPHWVPRARRVDGCGGRVGLGV